jgi:tetratricopeptide (TPR) repeat protein
VHHSLRKLAGKLKPPLRAAGVECGRYNAADQAGDNQYSRVLKIRRRVLGPEDLETMRTANNLAYAYMFIDRYNEATLLHEENLILRRKVLGAEHPDTLVSMSNLALCYQHLRRYEEAQTLLEQTLAIQRRLLGPSHANTLTTTLNLGLLFSSLGRLPEAERFTPKAWRLSVAPGRREVNWR